MAKIVEIYLSESIGTAMKNVELAKLEAGKEVVGDRYHSGKGIFSEKLVGSPDKS